MNERIKQLALEAGFVPWGDESWNLGDVIDWSSSYDTELACFAQLIIQECADVAGCNGHVSGFSLGDLIKNHFGIKE